MSWILIVGGSAIGLLVLATAAFAIYLRITEEEVEDETPRQWNETIAAPMFHNVDPGTTVTNTGPPDYGVPTTTAG